MRKGPGSAYYKWNIQVEHIRGHLWYRYSITVNQVMVAKNHTRRYNHLLGQIKDYQISIFFFLTLQAALISESKRLVEEPGYQGKAIYKSLINFILWNSRNQSHSFRSDIHSLLPYIVNDHSYQNTCEYLSKPNEVITCLKKNQPKTRHLLTSYLHQV